jgi:2-aminoethylphosphonate-pyruvate transaminase
MGIKPYVPREEQGPIIVTVHQPADPRFDFARFVEALKARGVLICNFWTTPEPTIRIGAIGALTPDDMQRALAIFRETLAEALPAAA